MRFAGETLDEECWGELVHQLKDLLPEAWDEALAESTRYLVGEVLDFHLLDRLCLRLAANKKRLRKEAIVPWTRQPESEWAAAQVIKGFLTHRHDTPGILASFKLLSGYAAGETTEKFWTTRYCRFLGRQLGYARRQPMLHVTEMVSMRMLVYVHAESSVRKPFFEHVSFPAAALEWNQKIIRMRRRLGFECPYDYSHPCGICAIGYADHQRRHCPVAVHPLNYVPQPCIRCKNQEALFDPGRPGARLCVNCSAET